MASYSATLLIAFSIYTKIKMNTELQNKVWSILPKEFKEEVKETFRKCLGVPKYEAITIKPMLLDSLFGHHNLTSDEEGEEILTCEKYKVEEALNYCDELDSISGSCNMLNWGKQMIAYLFGSKCLLDAHEDNFTSIEPKPAEPKFKIGDKVRVKFNAKELHSNPDPSKNIYYWQTTRDKYLGKVFKITDIWKSGTITLNTAEVMFWEPFDLEPYTEPKNEVVKMKPIKSYVSVYLATKEEDEEFRTLLYENGFMWSSGTALISLSNWDSDHKASQIHFVYHDKTVTYLGERTEETLTFTEFKKRYFGEDVNLSQETVNCDKQFDTILKNDFRDHNRLHIAAMIAQGIMANSNPQMVDTNVERVVDLAILTADTLIAKCEKGGEE